MQTLNVVQLCPAAFADAANAIAEAAGYGPNNLSVPLIAGDGAEWRGCCAWWTPEAFAAAFQPPLDPETGAPIPGAAEVLAQVRSYVRGPGASAFAAHVALAEDVDGIPVPSETWAIALAAEGLRAPEVEADG